MDNAHNRRLRMQRVQTDLERGVEQLERASRKVQRLRDELERLQQHERYDEDNRRRIRQALEAGPAIRARVLEFGVDPSAFEQCKRDQLIRPTGLDPNRNTLWEWVGSDD